MLRGTWELQTFVGERLRVSLGRFAEPQQRELTAREELELERRIDSLLFSPSPSLVRQLEQLYAALTERPMPLEYSPFELSGEAWQAELRRAFEGATSSGLLTIEEESRPRVAVRQDPSPVAPLGPVETVAREPARFQVRWVDEVGEALEGVELVFSSGRTKETKKTDSNGVARFESPDASFGSVRVVSATALSETLNERWSKPRSGAVADAPFTRRVAFSLDLPSVQLESDELHTVVLHPELGKLAVELWDKRGRHRHVQAAYTISGPASFEGTTDAEGRLLHEDVPSGDYTLTLTQTFPEELKLPPETHEAPLVVLRGSAVAPQVRRVGAIPHATLARLRGMVFDTNKTFLLPTAVPSLRRIRELYERQNPSQLLIVGHTDTSGEPAVNDPLSVERARSVEQYLTDDVDAWLKNYDASVPQKKRWGTREDRLMMLALDGYAARPSDKSAVLWYQERHNALVKSGAKPNRPELTADGKIGPKTRTELIFEYMSLDGASLAEREDFVIDIRAHGAGENFPLDAAGEAPDERAPSERNDEHDQRDRRVELFFFDDEFGVVPAPSGPSGEEYLVWRRLAADALDASVEGISQKATVLQVPSAHFRTGSAVLLPEGEAPTTGTGTALTSVGLLARALRFNEERSGHRVLVAGHTDSVGSDASNDALSEKRAELTHAVLTGQRETFVSIAHETGKVSDWKQILRWASTAVPGFERANPETIDDNASSGKPAAESFQRAYNENREALSLGSENLSIDGVVGKKTWGAIFDLYQWNLAEELGEVDEDQADADDSAARLEGLRKLQALLTFLPMNPPFVGFGEHFPADGIGKNDLASEANRRVEVLFFEEGHEPDLAILQEEPKLTELYSSDAFTRQEVPHRPGGAKPHCEVLVAFPGASPDNVCRIDEMTGKYAASQSGAPRILFSDIPRGAVLSLSETKESGVLFSEVNVSLLLPSGTVDRLASDTPSFRGDESVDFLDYSLEEVIR